MAQDRGSSSKPRRDPLRDGSLLYRNSRGEIGADFRWLERGRTLLRDPNAKGWTAGGDAGAHTTSETVARTWEARYIAEWSNAAIRAQMGIVTPADTALQSVFAETERYMAEKVRVVEEATFNNVRYTMRVLREMVGADTHVAAVTHEMLQRGFDARVDAGYAISTLRGALNRIRSFYRWLNLPDPAARVAVGRRGDAELEPATAWTDAEIAASRQAADEIDQRGHYGRLTISARLALELALGTGVREGELFALDTRDFRGAPTFDVHVHAQERPDKRAKPKSKRARYALVLPSLWPWLDGLPAGPILVNPDGSAIRKGTNRNALKIVMQRAGLKEKGDGVGTHMTRHTYSRLILERLNQAGVYGLPLLKEYLGHSTIRITEAFYGHYSNQIAVQHGAAIFYGAGEGVRSVVGGRG